MTADAIDRAREETERTPLRRAVILASITLAQTLYGMTFLMVAVVLPQIQGSLSATQDQISWVVTLNILATAIMTPMAGWLSAKFGCNSIGAGYTQSGSTVDAGALIAMRMACPDMSWETQGIAVLNRVMQVSAQGPTRVTLTSSAGTIELMRR